MKYRSARRLSKNDVGKQDSVVVRLARMLGKLAVTAALVTTIAASCDRARAQDPAPKPAPPVATKYETLPVAQEIIDDTRLRLETAATVRDILNGDVGLLGQEALFDAFYTRYVFAEMTQTDDASLAKIAKDRQKLLADLSRTKSTDAHKRLVDLALNTMTTVATGNFHPAVRYNAMLIIGELNDQEVVLIGEQTPPVPSLRALKVMLDELKNPDQIDAVRAAAIVGILRHAEYDGQRPDTQRMPADARKTVRDDMLAMLAQADPPPSRSAEGHQWLQRRAVEVLGALGEVGEGGNVLTALLTILDDASAPISYRCDAAIALGRLQFPQGFAVDPAAMAQKMGELATQIAREEVGLLEELLLNVDVESLQGIGRRGIGNQPRGPVNGLAPSGGQPSGTTVLRDGPLTSGSSKSSNSPAAKSGSKGKRAKGASGYSGGASFSGSSSSAPASGSGSYSGGGSRSYSGGNGSFQRNSGRNGQVMDEAQFVHTLDILRRRLAYRMYSLKLGLNGPGRDPGAFVALADADKKPFVDDVQKGVVELLNVAADDQLTLDKLNDKLLASVRRLEAVVKVANREDEGDAPEDVPGGGDVPRGDLPSGDLPSGDLPSGDVPGADGPAGGEAPEVGDVPGAEGEAVDLDLP
jgi:hypothetical protein